MLVRLTALKAAFTGFAHRTPNTSPTPLSALIIFRDCRAHKLRLQALGYYPKSFTDRPL